MRTTEILGALALTGAVATLAVLNVNGAQKGTFLASTPITEAEREFINFISNYHRNY